jgi:hypothetical protein
VPGQKFVVVLDAQFRQVIFLEWPDRAAESEIVTMACQCDCTHVGHANRRCFIAGLACTALLPMAANVQLAGPPTAEDVTFIAHGDRGSTPRRFSNTLSPNRLITSISPRRLIGVYGLVLQPDPETRPAASVREIDAAHPSKRKGSGSELEVVKVLQAMSPAKPATDPDSGIFTDSMA